MSAKKSIINNFQSVQEFEDYALQVLPKNAADYYYSGSDEQMTLENNKEAFKRLRIRPRILIDITDRSTETVVLGHRVGSPIGISPSAMQKLAHPDGECGNIRAAQSVNGVYILSTLSTTSMEDVAKAAPNVLKWYQLYIYKDREVTRQLVKRAEKAGFKALVLTVDANIFGKRRADRKNAFELPPHLVLGNFQDGAKSVLGSSGSSALTEYTTTLFDMGISWDHLLWLKSITNLPIVLKGVLTAEDAIKAADMGVEAVMVSNHGGRQLDTAPATIEALPEIVRAVGHRIEVYLDGGIRLGSDVFKALALGARMVFIGRPALWGLACNGEEGVKRVLDILIEEFDLTMGLTGCNSVWDIKPNMVVHKSFYNKL